MGIEGKCEKCGGATVDYGCLNCITGERDALLLQIDALRKCNCPGPCNAQGCLLRDLQESRQKIEELKKKLDTEIGNQIQYFRDGLGKHGFYLHPGLTPEQNGAEWRRGLDAEKNESIRLVVSLQKVVEEFDVARAAWIHHCHAPAILAALFKMKHPTGECSHKLAGDSAFTAPGVGAAGYEYCIRCGFADKRIDEKECPGCHIKVQLAGGLWLAHMETCPKLEKTPQVAWAIAAKRRPCSDCKPVHADPPRECACACHT